MTNNRMPKQWLVAGTESKKVTAKIDMSAEVAGAGLCPACKNKMEGPVFCGGKPMMVCWEDRVAMPYLDQEHKEHSETFIPFEAETEFNPFGM